MIWLLSQQIHQVNKPNYCLKMQYMSEEELTFNIELFLF